MPPGHAGRPDRRNHAVTIDGADGHRLYEELRLCYDAAMNGIGPEHHGIFGWCEQPFRSHRSARLALVITLSAALFAPLLLGYVVAAGNNRVEAGEAEPSEDAYPSSRLFLDHYQAFIPELHRHLTGDRHGWLAVWNPNVQLGRPSVQAVGLSRAYLPVFLLSFASADAHFVYTCLALLTLWLIGFFAFEFLAEMDLHPTACYASAVGLSLGIFCVYWLTFIMYFSTICWMLALFWLITRYARCPSFWTWTGIAFSVYSLFLTGYPVLIVLFGYALAAYSLVVLLRSGHSPWQKALLSAGMAAAAAVGLLASLPVYLDLFHAAESSARLTGVDDAWYVAVNPSITAWSDFVAYVAANVDPFSTGNPNLKPWPACFNEVLLSPWTVLLAGFSVTRIRSGRFWFWILAVAFYALLALWSPAYLFMVHHLGLHLSRCRCAWGILIPATVLAAFGIDAVLRGGFRGRLWSCYGACVLALAAMYLALAWSGKGFDGRAVAAAAAVAALVGVFLLSRSSALLGATVMVVSSLYAGQVAMLRPVDTICRRSPLTDSLRETADGSCRYAKIGRMAALPANEEAFLGLCSVHSYDPLSPRRYQGLVQSWCEFGCIDYGRWFQNLEGRLNADAPWQLALAGVKYLVSDTPLNLDWVEPASQPNGHRVYRSKLEPRVLCQTRDFIQESAESVRISAQARWQPARCAQRKDDWRQVRTLPENAQSLLFVSEQFHAHWLATSQGESLPTVAVNDFYLGVLLPPGTEEVELEFVPFARWAWIPQLAFAALALAWVSIAAYRKLGLQRLWSASR